MITYIKIYCGITALIFIFFSCEEKKENTVFEPIEYNSLRLELTKIIDYYEECKKINYSIDTTLFDFDYEIKILEANADYRLNNESDSSLVNKNFIFKSPPSNWVEMNSVSSDSCNVIYTGILISDDKSIQYAVAYSPKLDLKYRVEIRRNKSKNKWELILST